MQKMWVPQTIWVVRIFYVCPVKGFNIKTFEYKSKKDKNLFLGLLYHKMEEIFLKNEKKFLWILFLGAIFAYPYVIFRKSPKKDWIIVFLTVGFISSIIDKILTTKGYLK